MPFRPFPALLALVALPFAAAEPAVEAGVAAKVNETGREAIFFKSEDGTAIGVFLPEGKAGWSRQSLVTGEPGLAAFAIADFDGDGLLDLAVARKDSSFGISTGDGQGHFQFKANSRIDLASVPEALFAIRRTHDRFADLLAQDRQGERVRLENDGFAVMRRAEIRQTDDIDGRLITSPGMPPTIHLERSGRIEFPLNGVQHPIQSARAIRLAAIGRFDDDNLPDLAVISYGERPTLTIYSGSADGSFASQAVQPEIPQTTLSVTAICCGSFSPNPANINLNDTIQWNSLNGIHTVTQTTGLGSCTTQSGGFDSGSGLTTYSRQFTTAGTFFYKCIPHCAGGMKGTINVTAPPASPGTVPDTTTPFKIAKNATVASNLDLTWGTSCGASTTSYEVYQGTLPLTGTYSHASLNCNLGNVTATTVTPGAGNTYYLIVPRSGAEEGSYGKDSANAQIPAPAAGACLTQNLTGAC